MWAGKLQKSTQTRIPHGVVGSPMLKLCVCLVREGPALHLRPGRYLTPCWCASNADQTKHPAAVCLHREVRTQARHARGRWIARTITTTCRAHLDGFSAQCSRCTGDLRPNTANPIIRCVAAVGSSLDPGVTTVRQRGVRPSAKGWGADDHKKAGCVAPRVTRVFKRWPASRWQRGAWALRCFVCVYEHDVNRTLQHTCPHRMGDACQPVAGTGGGDPDGACVCV